MAANYTPQNSQNTRGGYSYSSTKSQQKVANAQSVAARMAQADKKIKEMAAAKTKNTGYSYAAVPGVGTRSSAQNSAIYGQKQPGDDYREYYDSRVAAAKTNPLSVQNYGGGNRAPIAPIVNPISSGSGSGGGFGGGGGASAEAIAASMPVEPSPEEQLASLLAALPKGPMGLENVQGAYQSAQGDYSKAQTTSDATSEATKAALLKMYGETNQPAAAPGNDYLAALQALNSQNQNTSVGTVDQLKGIRNTYLGDVGASLGARSAGVVSDITTEFNTQKALREKEIIDAFMEQQAELALASAEAEAKAAGGSSGGGGGGGGGSRRSSGGGSSSTGSASETQTVYNPQDLALLQAAQAMGPEVAAQFQFAWDQNFENTKGLSQAVLDGSTKAASEATKAAQARAKYQAIPKGKGLGITSVLPKLSAAINAAKSKNTAKTVAAQQAALALARQMGGTQTAPKITQTWKP